MKKTLGGTLGNSPAAAAPASSPPGSPPGTPTGAWGASAHILNTRESATQRDLRPRHQGECAPWKAPRTGSPEEGARLNLWVQGLLESWA